MRNVRKLAFASGAALALVLGSAFAQEAKPADESAKPQAEKHDEHMQKMHEKHAGHGKHGAGHKQKHEHPEQSGR